MGSSFGLLMYDHVPRAVLFFVDSVLDTPLLRSPLHAPFWRSVVACADTTLRWLSVHAGAPALLVAAVLLVVGYRLVKRSVRFAVEVALVASVLVLATELGWIHW